MQAHNWRAISQAYLDKNFSVIPIRPDKSTRVLNWSKYNLELPDEPLTDPENKQTGIAICPGPASGVMCIDIDTKDQDLLEMLKRILPTTPVQRFGSKGIGLIYAYNPNINSQIFEHIQVQIFANSGALAIPPSYHGEIQKEYKWIGTHDLLSINKDHLPCPTADDIIELRRLDQQYGRSNPIGRSREEGQPGRQIRLRNMGFAGLNKGKSFAEVARELVDYDYDSGQHNPPWFEQDKHARDKNHAYQIALNWVEGLQATREKHLKLEQAEVVTKKPAKEAFKFVPYAEPEGYMLAVLKYLMPQFREESYESSLTGAICLMSVLCGNRFRYKGTFSNMYVINLAETGSGKSYAMKKVIKELLMPVARDLVGRGSYQSESSIWHEFIKRKTFIDTLDEVSALFKRVGDNEATYSELLLNLWDDAPNEWITPQYSALNKEAAKLPSTISNPCLTIWGASTIKTFESVISETNYQTGLLPRTLILIKEGHGRIQEPQEPTDEAIRSMRGAIKQFIQDMPITLDGKDMQADAHSVTRDLGGDEAADRLFREYDRQMQVIMQATTEEAPKGFLSRYPQHLAKLSMIHAVSRNFMTPNQAKVEVQDIEWAHAFISAMRHNNTLFYTRTSTKGGFERQKAQVLAAIVKSEGGMSRTELTRAFRMNGKVMEQIIQDLLNAELILKIEDSPSGKAGRPKVRYVPLSD
jgi:hypothetical protein